MEDIEVGQIQIKVESTQEDVDPFDGIELDPICADADMRSHQCEVCGKCYASASYLRTHRNIHRQDSLRLRNRPSTSRIYRRDSPGGPPNQYKMIHRSFSRRDTVSSRLAIHSKMCNIDIYGTERGMCKLCVGSDEPCPRYVSNDGGPCGYCGCHPVNHVRTIVSDTSIPLSPSSSPPSSCLSDVSRISNCLNPASNAMGMLPGLASAAVPNSMTHPTFSFPMLSDSSVPQSSVVNTANYTTTATNLKQPVKVVDSSFIPKAFSSSSFPNFDQTITPKSSVNFTSSLPSQSIQDVITTIFSSHHTDVTSNKQNGTGNSDKKKRRVSSSPHVLNNNVNDSRPDNVDLIHLRNYLSEWLSHQDPIHASFLRGEPVPSPTKICKNFSLDLANFIEAHLPISNDLVVRKQFYVNLKTIFSHDYPDCPFYSNLEDNRRAYHFIETVAGNVRKRRHRQRSSNKNVLNKVEPLQMTSKKTTQRWVPANQDVVQFSMKSREELQEQVELELGKEIVNLETIGILNRHLYCAAAIPYESIPRRLALSSQLLLEEFERAFSFSTDVCLSRLNSFLDDKFDCHVDYQTCLTLQSKLATTYNSQLPIIALSNENEVRHYSNTNSFGPQLLVCEDCIAIYFKGKWMLEPTIPLMASEALLCLLSVYYLMQITFPTSYSQLLGFVQVVALQMEFPQATEKLMDVLGRHK